MSTIVVPFCFLPNSLTQKFDLASTKRSEFQIRFLEEISKRGDFAYFVLTSDEGKTFIMHPDYIVPFTVFWYDKEGCFNVDRIGRQRVLSHSCKKGSSPAPLNDCVYKVRCS